LELDELLSVVILTRWGEQFGLRFNWHRVLSLIVSSSLSRQLRMHSSDLHACRTLPELLQARATLHPGRTAAIFVEDNESTSEVTYQELWSQSLAVAKALCGLDPNYQTSGSGDAPRVLLVQPAGLPFLSAFFGAQIAGWIPVPTSYPKPHRPMPRVDAVTRDCDPLAILTTTKSMATIDKTRLSSQAAALPMIAVDSLLPDTGHDASFSFGEAYSADSIALLQYTSGSTNDPKGVIVSQRNIMANIASISPGFRLQFDQTSAISALTTTSWLPFFHDMGLMSGILAPLYAGYRSVLMSPQAFMRRPIQWLQLISDYQASISGAPNFAYELCADRVAPDQMATLDLKHWTLAFCGAEPIRARTLHTFAQRFSSVGFSQASFYPCYGLAESTLLAAGGAGPAVPRVIDVNRNALRDSKIELAVSRSKRDVTSLVSCGSAPQDTILKIVDPQSCIECNERSIGEIWLRGESITRGYWNRPSEDSIVFATLCHEPKRNHRFLWFGNAADAPLAGAQVGKDKLFFRTGDLGFLDNGELFVTGRIKDVVIIRGRNYFPQDIEATVLSLGHPISDRTVAFSVEGPRAEGLAIVVEIARDTPEPAYKTIVRDIRRAVIEEHEIDPRIVMLVRPGTISVTTSGKLQRSACRIAMTNGSLEYRYRWERSGGTESPPLPIPELPAVVSPSDQPEIETQVRDWLRMWFISRVGIEPSEIDFDRRFDDYGLDSLTAVELSGELEDWSGVELTPATARQHPTITTMAEFVANGLVGRDPSSQDVETIAIESESVASHAWTAAANR